MEDVGIFHEHLVYVFDGHLVHYMTIWYILWPFGIFFPFWYVVPRKIWQPCSEGRRSVPRPNVASTAFLRDLSTT
jgi:hypothetical protein